MTGGICAGIGFRAGAPLASLQELLAGFAPGGRIGLAARHRVHPLALALEAEGYRLAFFADAEIAATQTLTQSPIAIAQYGTGSLAEACALLAVGPGARLLAPRILSADRMASAAFAQFGASS